MSKYRILLEESVIKTSTNRGFRTIQCSVATYEQTKKRIILILSKKNSRRRWNPHKTFTIVNFDSSFDCLFIFILSN